MAALDFGITACDFSHESACLLKNTSVVPARFSWRALGTLASTTEQNELQVDSRGRVWSALLLLLFPIRLAAS